MLNNIKQPWISDQGDGTYRNPVLYADYSDPDVIRAGEDFYMTASSFSHMPGLPILHSKDLINWTLIGHAVQSLELPGYDRPLHGCGVWAPAIRYHNGEFWIFFSTPDEGIFMTKAKDPAGPWSPLHCVKEVKGWIDPCPFWDDDGEAYLVHAFAHSRSGIKHKLQLLRMSPDGRQLLGEGKLIFDGTESHPTMEGPKLYKRNGYYYVFAPAGGVRPGWQTVLRSQTIDGPYEDKIVLHQGGTDVNGPHQGGWVELESGESWFVHFQDRDAYGRIVHVQPVRWENDWPLMGVNQDANGIGEPVSQYRKPDVGRQYPFAVPDASDDFELAKLGLQWQWQANPKAEWYSLTAKKGHIRLYAAALDESRPTLYDAPQLLMQKFPAPVFTATAKLDFHAASPGDRCGLVVFGLQYAGIGLSKEEGGRLSLIQWKGGTDGESAVQLREVPSSQMYLRVTVSDDAVCLFSYSFDGTLYYTAGVSFQAKEGRWVGAKTGIFAAGNSQASSGGYADFDWFIVEK